MGWYIVDRQNQKPYIEARNIEFSYGDKTIIKNLSLDLYRSEIVGLLGYSGEGKTSLGKILASYLKCTKGDLLIDSKPPLNKGFNPVQMVHQHPEKSVNPLWRLSKVLDEAELDRKEIIKKLRIQEAWLKRLPFELSGGELQRICIARVLDKRTKFLILDEITTMLDGISKAKIWNEIKKECKKRNIGMLIISHEEKLLDLLVDRKIEFSDINNL